MSTGFEPIATAGHQSRRFTLRSTYPSKGALTPTLTMDPHTGRDQAVTGRVNIAAYIDLNSRNLEHDIRRVVRELQDERMRVGEVEVLLPERHVR